MTTLNGVPFRQMLVPASKYSIKCPYPMVAKKVTFHNTDNEMPAENEINYMRNNGNMTSYHLATDEKETIQGLPFDRNGWHAGDGGNGYGNRNTIGWEICRNYDRKRKTTRLIQPLAGMYDKAEMNTIKSAPAVFKKLGIVATIETVKKHQDWSGKNCPSKILNEARWGAFQVAVILEYNRYVGKGPVANNPSEPAKPTPSTEAKLIKNENAFFLVTTPDGIKVRNKPSVSATHTGTLKKGDSINYKRVFEGGGYRWLEYTGNSGNTLYVPYRESGSGKEQWGTFHSSRPQSTQDAPKPAKKSNTAIAQEVIDGKWGNNPQRKQKLEAAGYNYAAIQAEVNRLAGAKPKKTIDQMAREVIAGKHGQGHVNRQKSLGISNAEYQKVRARVNQLA